MNNLIQLLYENNCIKTGSFTLKNGKQSSIYIDLKNIISYPFLVNKIASQIYNIIKCERFNRICGIPYGAIPISSIIAFNHNIPMILVRKEIKKYGLKKSIEGEYNKNDEIILIEDTITTGSSLIKFIKLLEKEGLVIKKIIVICDRREIDLNNTNVLDNYSISSLISIDEIMDYLNLNNPLNNNLGFNENILTKLINIIQQKNSNNIISLRHINVKENINTSCILKINSSHVSENAIKNIVLLSKKNNFLLMDTDIFNYNQVAFYELFVKSKDLYKWINIINVEDKYLCKYVPIIEKLNINIGIVICYTDLELDIFEKIIETYNKYIIGTRNVNIKINGIFNMDEDFNSI